MAWNAYFQQYMQLFLTVLKIVPLDLKSEAGVRSPSLRQGSEGQGVKPGTLQRPSEQSQGCDHRTRGAGRAQAPPITPKSPWVGGEGPAPELSQTWNLPRLQRR